MESNKTYKHKRELYSIYCELPFYVHIEQQKKNIFGRTNVPLPKKLFSVGK